LVEVTKADITKYINENKKKYEIEASRDINFVQFQEVASVEDEEEVKAILDKFITGKVEFVNGKNDTIAAFTTVNEASIENYVNNVGGSDLKYNDRFLFKSNLPPAIADSIFNLNVNELYGPFKDGQFFKLSKVVAETQLPDSVKVRHILIPFIGARSTDPTVTKTDDEAKKTADSLLSVVKANRSKFPDLVTAFSSDQGSVQNGGEYDFHPYNTMVKPFNDFEFENKKGDIGVVKTDFGYHIIEILDQKNMARALKIATIARKIEPSEKTVNDLFNTTQKFEIAIQDEDFQEVATKNDYEVRPVNTIKELQESIPGLGSQRAIVRWAFEDATKTGDYKRFSIPTGGYVVVQLAAINKKGLMSVENASVTAIPEIRKEKKAKLIREKIKSTTVDEVAKNQNVSTSTAVAINMKTPTLSGAGQEPKIVGAAFGLKQGQTSKLIDGNKGVFIIEVTKVTEAPKLENYQANTNRLSTTRVNSAQTKIYNALKEAADIEDNRAIFY
jgi:peptidyl-prolyl cis-trans isomerase D